MEIKVNFKIRTEKFLGFEFELMDDIYIEESDEYVSLFRLDINFISPSIDIYVAYSEDYDIMENATPYFTEEQIQYILVKCLEAYDKLPDYTEDYLDDIYTCDKCGDTVTFTEYHDNGGYCKDCNLKTFEELSPEDKASALSYSYLYLRTNHAYLFTDEDIAFFNEYDFSNFLNEYKSLPVTEQAKEQILDEARQYGIEFGYKEGEIV